MLTVAEASRKMGISASLVYELIRLGVIRHTRHGRPGRRGTIRLSEDAVAEYLASCERDCALLNDRETLKHIR